MANIANPSDSVNAHACLGMIGLTELLPKDSVQQCFGRTRDNPVLPAVAVAPSVRDVTPNHCFNELDCHRLRRDQAVRPPPHRK